MQKTSMLNFSICGLLLPLEVPVGGQVVSSVLWTEAAYWPLEVPVLLVGRLSPRCSVQRLPTDLRRFLFVGRLCPRCSGQRLVTDTLAASSSIVKYLGLRAWRFKLTKYGCSVDKFTHMYVSIVFRKLFGCYKIMLNKPHKRLFFPKKLWMLRS